MTDRETLLRVIPLYGLAAALPISLGVSTGAAITLLLGAALVAVRERDRAAWPARGVLVSLAALVLVYAVATAAAPHPHWGKWLEELWIKLLVVAVPLLAGRGRGEHLRRAVVLLLVAGTVASAFGIWQHFSGIDPLRGDRSLMTEWGHHSAAAFFGHHLAWGGQLLVLVLLLASWLAATDWRRSHWLVLAGLGLHGLALLWSYARSSLIGVMAGLVVMVLLLRGRRRLVGLALLVLPIMVGLALPDVRLHLERLTWTGRYETRLNLWESSLAGIADRPLTGWGPGNFEAMMAAHGVEGYYEVHGHSHNDPLMHAVNAGLPGLLAALALLATVVAVLWRAWRREVRAAWVVLAALAIEAGITAAGMFQVYQTDDEVEILLYFVLGCALALSGRDCQAGPRVRH